MALSNTFSGARALFSIGQGAGKPRPIGFASGCSGDENVDYEPVEVLDLLKVREFVPVAYRVSLNCAIFRVIGQSLKAQKIMPKYQDILSSGDLVCTVIDDAQGFTVYQYENCKATTTSFDINARGVVAENVGFVAIQRKDEYDLQNLSIDIR